MEIQTIVQVTYVRLDGDANNITSNIGQISWDANNITSNIGQNRWRCKQHYK